MVKFQQHSFLTLLELLITPPPDFKVRISQCNLLHPWIKMASMWFFPPSFKANTHLPRIFIYYTSSSLQAAQNKPMSLGDKNLAKTKWNRVGIG